MDKRLRPYVKAKGHHFGHQTKTGSFQSRQQSIPRKTRYVSRNFRRSYLKANKVSKSEGTRTVEYTYHF